MVDFSEVVKLMRCFPGSFVNAGGDLVVHRKANEYFNVLHCETVTDLQCKALEWFSRGASKGQPYGSERANEEFRRFMRRGINCYLGTKLGEEEFDIIYTYLGNACNHKRTVQFIASGYDVQMLTAKENE